MRRMYQILLVVCMVLMACSLVGAANPNMLVNGDFSDGLTSWRVYYFSGKGTAVVDQGAARIDTFTATDRMTLSQVVNVQAGATYVLSGQVKTANINGKGGYVRIQYKDSADKRVGNYPLSADFQNIPDWQDFSLVLTPPNRTTTMLIELFMENCSGTIWYRNIELQLQ